MELLQSIADLLTQSGAAAPHFFFYAPLFLLCFTLFYGLYLLAVSSGSVRARAGLIAAFSLFFYFQFGGWWVLLLPCTALIDWLVGLSLPDSKPLARRFLLGVSLASNLGLLAWFKYKGFLFGAWVDLAAGQSPDVLGLLAPLGLSYTAFKSISYLLDVANEEIETPESDFLSYLAFVSFFPNLIAGPIHRATEWLPQLHAPFSLSREQVGRAFFLFVTGLFKKVAIADPLAADYLNRIFDDPTRYSGFENLMATYAYGIHLYCDFSGYTDMVLAIALLLGFDLAANFNEPFKARNVGEFWRRWHITLSTWFQDYVYTPMNYYLRSWKRWGAIVAVLFTFLLSGLWHGAGWTYILWGGSHGLAIGWETLTLKSRLKIRKRMSARVYDFLSLLLTFQFLSLTYVLFRSPNLASAGAMFGRIFGDSSWHLAVDWVQAYPRVLTLLLLGLFLHFLPLSWKTALCDGFTRLHWTLKAVVCSLFIVLIYQVQTAEPQPVVYLQF